MPEFLPLPNFSLPVPSCNPEIKVLFLRTLLTKGVIICRVRINLTVRFPVIYFCLIPLSYPRVHTGILHTQAPLQWQKQCGHWASIPPFPRVLSPLMFQTLDIQNVTGPATSLFINSSIPKPSPKPTDAIVKVKCFGLNRMDLLQREGHYPLPPQAPSTLGVEFSGTIESFGSDAEEDFKVGDEVFGLAYGGAYAEYIAVSTHMLIHKPKELSWEQAAGVPEV